MSDLSLVLWDDICEEIKKRYDGFIFIGVKNLDGKSDSLHMDFGGGKTQVLGLLEWGADKMKMSLREQTKG